MHVIALAETFDSAMMREVEHELVAAEGTNAQIIVLDVRALEFNAAANLRVVAIRAPESAASDSPD